MSFIYVYIRIKSKKDDQIFFSMIHVTKHGNEK